MKLLHDHIVMPEELTLDNEVSFTAKGLYAYLLLRPEPENCMATGIAMTMRENEAVIIGALRELEAKGYVTDTDAGHALEAAPKPDKRDPNINKLIEHFESTMALKMPRPQFQRRAASTLLKQRGIEVCLRAVDAVAACRYEKYAPRILSLEDLRDKWNGLVDFYTRNGKQLKEDQAARAEISGMTGVER